MAKFRVTWPSGLTTEETSEVETVEAYAMERWGANGVADVEAHGVKIELIDEQVITSEDVGDLNAVLGSAPEGIVAAVDVTDSVDATVTPAPTE